MKLKNNEEKNDPLQEKETRDVEGEIEVIDQIEILAEIIIDHLLKSIDENKETFAIPGGNVGDPYCKETQ